MRKMISGCFAASVLLAFGVTVQASPGSDWISAAMDSGKPVLMAQAPAAAPAAAPSAAPAGAPAAAPAAGAPSGEDVSKMKKRAATKKRPSRAEMEKIKQHVPAEYHQYLNFR